MTKKLIIISIFILLLIALFYLFKYEQRLSDPSIENQKAQLNTSQTGDIIFQTSLSDQSLAIHEATNSKYSHMGMVIIKDSIKMVLEAIQPVQYTKLEDWINRGENQKYVVKRLKKADLILTDSIINMLIDIGETFLDKDYDKYFEWSDERMYCSELVWKIYNRVLALEIGESQQLKEFDLSSTIVKNKLLERYGKDIPYNEPVISPAAMFDSKLLESMNINNLNGEI